MEKFQYTIDGKPELNSRVLFMTRYGLRTLLGRYNEHGFISNDGKVHDPDLDVTKWKYNRKGT